MATKTVSRQLASGGKGRQEVKGRAGQSAVGRNIYLYSVLCTHMLITEDGPKKPHTHTHTYRDLQAASLSGQSRVIMKFKEIKNTKSVIDTTSRQIGKVFILYMKTYI